MTDLYTEILKSESMTLTDCQVAALTEAYAESIVDRMDMDDLINFAVESLIAEYNKYTTNELLTEIEELYGEEELYHLVQNVINEWKHV